MNNLKQVGKKFILQGGTHKNLAVVKTQVDFIRSKVPDADVVVHPYSGEAGAIGAALVSLDWWEKGGRSQFRGFDVIEKLTYNDDHREGHRLQLVPGELPAQFHRRGVARRPGPRVEQGSAVPRLGARHRQQLLPQGAGGRFERNESDQGRNRENQECLSQYCRHGSARRLPPQSPSPPKDRSAIRVGIPKVLNMWSTHQFWVAFLREIGIASENIVFSSDTSEEQGREFGKGRGTVDCCYPVKAMSGHYGELVFGQKKKAQHHPEPHDLFAAVLHAGARFGKAGLHARDGRAGKHPRRIS